MQAPVTEAPMLSGGLVQRLAQFGIVRPAVPIPHGRTVSSDQGTRPPLAHLVALFEMSDGLAPGGGRHHFFVSRSFSAELSSIASARSRFSFAFSSSSAFSRFASEGSMPPNLAFQL